MDESRVGVGVWLDDEVLLPVYGVIDTGVAASLHAALSKSVRDGGRYVIVDLAEATAIDRIGRAVLAAAADHLASLDGLLMLALPDRAPAPAADASALRALFSSP